MKDSELRGLILRAMYEVRHSTHWPRIPTEVPGLPDIDPGAMYTTFNHLTQLGLVEFSPHSGGPSFGRGRITAYGVDVVEGSSISPIAITIDSSITVHGSQNVQIGGHGNTQTATIDIEKMVNLIDSSDASVIEREEAKSLLKRIAENPLVKAVLEKWMKSLGAGS